MELKVVNTQKPLHPLELAELRIEDEPSFEVHIQDTPYDWGEAEKGQFLGYLALQHDAWCFGGQWIAMPVMGGRAGRAAMPCPTCEKEKRTRDIEQKLASCGIGAKYLNKTWGDLEIKEPMTKVKKACDNINEMLSKGQSAIFTGSPGTGKSQSSIMLMKSAIQAGYTAELINIGSLGMAIRAGYNTEGETELNAVNRLSSVDLLVFDDIGAGETGNASIEKRILYMVLESRQNQCKATILTTNLTMPELITTLGERTLNRMYPLKVLTFSHGTNYRKTSEPSIWD